MKTFIFLFPLFFALQLQAGQVIKVKKSNVLFTLEGVNNAFKGAEIIIQNDSDEVITGKIIKKGKTKAVARLDNPKHASLVKKNDEVTSSGRGKKVQENSSNTTSSPSKENGFFFEPFLNGYVGKNTYKSSATGSLVGTSELTMNSAGANFGALAGYHINGIFISPWLSLSLGSQTSIVATYQTTPAAENVRFSDNSFSKNTIGGYLGYQVTAKNRIWAMGGLVGMSTKSPDGTKTEYKGTSLGGGMSWRINDKFTANATIIMTNYSEENGKKFPYTEAVNASLDATGESYQEIYTLIGVSYYLKLF